MVGLDGSLVTAAVCGLAGNRPYQFAVQAGNAGGWGPVGPASSPAFVWRPLAPGKPVPEPLRRRWGAGHAMGMYSNPGFSANRPHAMEPPEGLIGRNIEHARPGWHQAWARVRLRGQLWRSSSGGAIRVVGEIRPRGGSPKIRPDVVSQGSWFDETRCRLMPNLAPPRQS